MDSRRVPFFVFLVFALLSSSPQAFAEGRLSLVEAPFKVWTPFSIELDNLQDQINYTFKNVGLLRRAMTHASFSEENNRALAMLGASVIKTSIALQSLSKNVDISAKDLNAVMIDVSKVHGSCNTDGTNLGLEKIVRVSHRTTVAESVVCGAFRAIFGAIAVDAGSSDEAGRIYEKVHAGFGEGVAM